MSQPPPVRDVIRQKVERGELPAASAEAMFAGNGMAGPCDGCGVRIVHTEIACGFDYPDRTYRLHLECAAVWASLRRSAPPDRPS